MKRILIAFLSVFFANVALADNLLHINSNIVGEIVKKHIPPTKQFQALFEYNQIVKERGGITPDEIRRVCASAGWQTDFAHAMTDGAKCDVFVEDLLKNASVKLYEVCGKEKGKSGGNEKCINDFQALTTNMIQATGLAKLYAYHKDKTEKVVCSNTARNETTNNTSTIRGGMNAGMAPTISTTTYYVQCKSLDKNIFYEFKFNNTRGTSDSTNHRSFKTGICSVFGYKFQGATKKDNREKSGWDICDGATQNACGMINNALNKAHSGYFASWGPLNRTLSTGKHSKVNEAGAGYELSASQLPYCILTANAGIKYDGTAYERTAFGLDGRYFLSKDIQTQGTAELHEYIRKYVASRGIQIQEFSCAETYVTVKLAGRSDSDDMITCTINGSTVDFFFDDLSESKDKYIKGAKQALDCIVAGGTFTGKKCVGLNKEQCNTVRNANAVSCPECKQIKWNETEQICELPASASAQNLRRGLTYAAIVGGAAASVVITVGTLGTATAPTAVVLTGLAVELLGAGIELKSQVAIDNKADEFFTKANNCKNTTCAEKLVKEYLQALSNQQNDLSDTEIGAADKVFADLFEKIPANSKFYKDIIEQGINGQTIESNKRGFFDTKSWNSDQIWRAVGIGLQIIPTVASVGWKIAKKSDKLVKSTAKLRSKLDDASKYIDDALGLKQTDDAIAMMDMWTGATSGTGNSLQKELTLLEELKDARQGKTGSRLGSAVLDDLSDETKMLLAQNGNDVDAVIRQMSKGLESVNQNTLILNRELQLLDELEDAKQAKTGSRMYSGVYEDLSEETKRLLAQNGNDISKARQRLNLAAQKLEYKPGNQTLGDFILSPDLESIGGEYSTWNSELSKLKKDVVTKQANGEDATRALAKLRSAASDAVDARLIEQNAIFYKENIARILASDEDLLKQFNNFENLSHGEKERFIRTFINRHGTNLGVSEDVEISLISKFADDPEAIGRCCGVNNVTGKGIIYISEDNLIKAGNGSAKNGLIAAPSHEYGHFVDGVDPNKGVLGSQVSDISQNFYGKQSNKTLEGWLTYTSRPTEKSSFPIGNIVGDDFSDGLRQTITAGKMPTTTISKIDDFKIKYAVPNINPTYVENGGDAYFFIQARPENITGLSNYFRQKGLRVKTTTYGVRVFEKL